MRCWRGYSIPRGCCSRRVDRVPRLAAAEFRPFLARIHSDEDGDLFPRRRGRVRRRGFVRASAGHLRPGKGAAVPLRQRDTQRGLLAHRGTSHRGLCLSTLLCAAWQPVHRAVRLRGQTWSGADHPNGASSDYVSHVTVFDRARPVLTKAIRVNDFLGYDGVNVYQQDYGWAPTMVVTNPAGHTVFAGPVQLSDVLGQLGNKAEGIGVLKVPDFGYTIPGARSAVQLGARMALFPDARVNPSVGSNGAIDPTLTQYGPAGLTARNPVIELQLYVRDLGLNQG